MLELFLENNFLVPFKIFASLKKIVTGGRCSLRGILDVSDHSLNIMERPSHKGNF